MSIWDRIRAAWQGWFPESGSDSSVPGKGRWLSADDPEVAALEREYEQRQAEEERQNALSRKRLSELLVEFDGNLGAALAAKMLTDGEPTDEILETSDAMMRGNLNDAEFAILKQLPKLRRIWLRDVEISDDGLRVLADMPQIEELSLAGNSEGPGLTDHCFRFIGNLPRLRKLSLEYMQRLTGIGLQELQFPDVLRELDFMRSTVGDEGLAQIVRFPKLERLGLWKTKITDRGLAAVGRCTSLLDLELSETAVGDNGIAHLAGMPALAGLRLNETQVTDACLPSLLQMPALRSVTFGDGISVATIEALRARGIEVAHGRVTGLHRTMNVLRYAGTDYEVDCSQSALRAFLSPGARGISWQLEIQCTDAYLPEYTQPAHLEGPPMKFRPASWRDLAGHKFSVKYYEGFLHPILPDNPCNIYIGYHACPNDHHIQIRERRGSRFLVEWTCVAKEAPWMDENPVYVLAEIPITEVVVWSKRDDDLSADRARKIVERHFRREDLGEPQVSGSRVAFRVIASD